jgi:hypothetical protein
VDKNQKKNQLFLKIVEKLIFVFNINNMQQRTGWSFYFTWPFYYVKGMCKYEQDAPQLKFLAQVIKRSCLRTILTSSYFEKFLEESELIHGIIKYAAQKWGISPRITHIICIICAPMAAYHYALRYKVTGCARCPHNCTGVDHICMKRKKEEPKLTQTIKDQFEQEKKVLNHTQKKNQKRRGKKKLSKNQKSHIKKKLNNHKII